MQTHFDGCCNNLEYSNYINICFVNLRTLDYDVTLLIYQSKIYYTFGGIQQNYNSRTRKQFSNGRQSDSHPFGRYFKFVSF